MIDKGTLPSRGPAVLCSDCESNTRLKNELEGFKIIMEVRQVSRMFVFWFPWLLILAVVVQLKQTGSVWRAVGSTVVPWALWVFNVFWFYPVKNLDIWKKGVFARRMEECRDKMFAAKVTGPKRRGRV